MLQSRSVQSPMANTPLLRNAGSSGGGRSLPSGAQSANASIQVLEIDERDHYVSVTPPQQETSGSSAAASAAAAPSLRGPTLEQLHALIALPSGMVGMRSQASSGRSRKGSRKQGSKLAREAQCISRFFSAEGPRPFPSNGLSLEQGIQMEFLVSAFAFATSATNGTPTGFSIAFTISQFAAAATVLTVFDQYRFDQIEVWLETNTPNASLGFPQLFTCVDLDDANVPALASQVEDHIGALGGVTVGGRYHRWKPHTAVAVYSGAFTSFANAQAQWIDSASPNVQHYGFKALAVSQGSVVGYQYTARAVCSFRAPAIN